MLLKEQNGNENNKNWIVIGTAMTKAMVMKTIHFLRFFLLGLNSCSRKKFDMYSGIAHWVYRNYNGKVLKKRRLQLRLLSTYCFN